MKNTILLLFIIVSLISCKKSSTPAVVAYKCATCIATPQAIAANDAGSKGIYKGVVSGSTGTIVFDVQNAGTTITAIMVLDGVTVNLTSGVTWVANQPYVAPFTGTLNNLAVSITFSVGSSGGTPTVTTSSIPGHPGSSFKILKETSTSLVEVFEGAYHTTLPEDGTFNLILSRSAKIWGADARKVGATATTGSAGGTITADNKLVDTGTIVGTLSGDEITGTSLDGNGKTVTIAAKRTL
ncbi:MAG: hypothetical protein JWO92_942 [Chitinophagaceae bacterium]|nr:hypothetical protein [Chitinophagaceae bacterium]